MPLALEAFERRGNETWGAGQALVGSWGGAKQGDWICVTLRCAPEAALIFLAESMAPGVTGAEVTGSRTEPALRTLM